MALAPAQTSQRCRGSSACGAGRLAVLAAALGGAQAVPPPAEPVAVHRLPLRTEGRWIVGRDGRRVKLACLNWSGAEERDGVVGGLQRRSAAGIAQTFRDMGFNCVRLPWSVEMVLTDPAIIGGQADRLLSAARELTGKTTLQILDAVVTACADAGLMIILDNHMSDGDWCCGDLDENGLWYNTRWSHLQWLEAHTTLARRYAGQPWVVASELRNEVRNSIVGGLWRVATWGGGGPNDWHAAAREAGNAILRINPNLLIVIGGLNWGKDLSGVYSLPVALDVPRRVVYSAHGYSWSYPGSPNKYETLKARLGDAWGFIVEPDKPYTAPVFVSEFGTFSDCHHASCAYWWPDFLQYLEVGDFDWAAWHADGTNSRGGHRKFAAPTNYGVLAADWQTPAGEGELLGALQTLQSATLGPGISGPACDQQCADTWESGWSSGRIGAAACSTCLRNRHCRRNVSAERWCTETWAAQECGWTCCRAGLLGDGACLAGHCKSRYVDKWDPAWPDGRSDSEACLRCLRDPVCRHGLTEVAWCARPWAAYHCELTCCIQGHYAPDALRPGVFV